MITLVKDLGMEYNEKYKRNIRIGLYRCEYCGNEKKIRMSIVKSYTINSCGCMKGKLVGLAHTTHGMCGTRIYSCWRDMNKRCKSKGRYFKWYGSKGISVCKEWKDFNKFYEDNKEKYRDNLTLDRIDSNGNYEVSNCQWITLSENISKAHLNTKHNILGVA